MIPKLRRSALLAASAAAAMVAAAVPAQAGLFDFLFGQQPAPSYQPVPQYGYGGEEPLKMRVNPRRRRAVRVRTEHARSEHGRPQKLATPIDPVKNPTWYLQDPTLRRGDIVVLKGKVLVFDGGRAPLVPSDFTSLEQSRLLSKSERLRIGKMASVPSESSPDAKPALTKEVALHSPE